MGEAALDDPAPGVHPVIAPSGSTDHLLEHRRRPAVEAALDDPEGRVECLDERIGTEHVHEVVVAGAVVRGVRERRRLRAGLTGEVAQPEHPLAGEVADGRPERPALGRRLDRQLLVGHRRHDVAEAPVEVGHVPNAARIVMPHPTADLSDRAGISAATRRHDLRDVLPVRALVAGHPVRVVARAALVGSRRSSRSRSPSAPSRPAAAGRGRPAARPRCVGTPRTPGANSQLAVVGLPHPGTRAHALPGRLILGHDPQDVAAEDVVAGAEVGKDVVDRPARRPGGAQLAGVSPSVSAAIRRGVSGRMAMISSTVSSRPIPPPSFSRRSRRRYVGFVPGCVAFICLRVDLPRPVVA